MAPYLPLLLHPNPMLSNLFKGNSQPRVEILGKTNIVHRLYSLLDEAREHVTLVSPYLSIEKLRDVERKIRQALERRVDVSLVMRAPDDSTRGPSDAGQGLLSNLANAGLQISLVQDLHAKLYYSERHALITSLNLLDSSFNNSIEIGAWIPAGREEYSQTLEFFQREVAPHARSITRPSQPAPARSAPSRSKPAAPRVEMGVCIRCCAPIPLDPARPYCSDDYAVWRTYSNPDYEDDYCHRCGEEYPATMNKPLCRQCYKAVG